MDEVRLGNIDRLRLKVLLDFKKNNSVTLMSRAEKLAVDFVFTVRKMKRFLFQLLCKLGVSKLQRHLIHRLFICVWTRRACECDNL